jgi:hypothetical protein
MGEIKKAVLICPRCGRRAERLMAMPLPRNHAQTVEEEGVVCERCLRDLEKELQREETLTLPPR